MNTSERPLEDEEARLASASLATGDPTGWFDRGAGQPLFTDLKQRANLNLIQSKAHDSGILTVRYLPLESDHAA
jgi:hypothetical protein